MQVKSGVNRRNQHQRWEALKQKKNRGNSNRGIGKKLTGTSPKKISRKKQQKVF